MSAPRFPSDEELKRARKFAPEKAAELIEIYCQCWRDENKRANDQHASTVRSQNHACSLTTYSLWSGTILAAFTLVVVAYAVSRGANLVEITYPLGTVTSIAGVFFYRASKSVGSSQALPSGNSRAIAESPQDQISDGSIEILPPLQAQRPDNAEIPAAATDVQRNALQDAAADYGMLVPASIKDQDRREINP